MITENRFESRRNQRADAPNNVTGEGFLVTRLVQKPDFKAGYPIWTAFGLTDSNPYLPTAVTGLVPATARIIQGMKVGQRYVIEGKRQMKGYITLTNAVPEVAGVQQIG